MTGGQDISAGGGGSPMVMMRAAVVVCLVFILVCMPGCGGKAAKPPETQDLDHPIQWLEVSVVYEDGSLVPSGSILTVTLEDISKMAVSNRFVGETVLDVQGPAPFVSSIGFNPRLIHEDHRYGVRAVIRHYKRLLYASTQVAVPFDKQTPGPLTILLKRVPRPHLIHSR